ncbi:MAG: NADP-dependent 3-hydroxy acid dehydrogenase YdfG [Saprospiraceae bacterium]|jgi:NADP-dependent 3-hydroxy acid dehydrogenase YdfG
MESLQNKNVIIIGATGGIGEEVAKMMKSSKANLFLTGRDEAKLKTLADKTGAKSYVLDISDENAVNAVAEQIQAEIGQADILINAAGIGIVKPFDALTYEDFDRTISANLRGPFNLLKAFLPAMKAAKKGLIVNMPGVLGKTPMAGASIYAASKYGLNGMLKSVREELRRTEVRITNIYLGGVDTSFWEEDIDIRYDAKKFITAKEAATSVWFLCQQPTSGVVSEMVLQPFNHQAI